MNPSALISFCHVTWHRWSHLRGRGRGGSEAARASQSRERAAEASSARRGRSFLSPPPSVPAAPLHLSPALSPAPSLSPLLNWHRSGWKHDNRKAFRRGALSGSPRPRSPPTQISRRQREGGGERIAVSYQRVLRGNYKRALYRTHARTHTRSYVPPRITDLRKCSTRLKVKMHVRGLIRATLGFAGFCLVAFVQQSASGSKPTQGKFSRQNDLFSSLSSFSRSALWRWYLCKAGGDDISNQRCFSF